MTREEFLDSVCKEREYQVARWGNEADDTANEPNDWVSYINHYSTSWFPGGFVPYTETTVEAFQRAMIKVAAIATAAVESMDRQQVANGKPFYQR